MSLESRIQALEDHCNHSLANAKLIATGGITLLELHADVLECVYLGCDDDAMDVEELAQELAQENASLRDDLDAAIMLIGELMIERRRG